MSAVPVPEPDDAQVIEARFDAWRGVQVTREHATYLSSCAITPAIAKDRVRSITTADEMPEEFTFWRDAVPGLVFTWTTPDTEDSPSRTVLQYKPNDGKSGPEDVRPTDSKGKQRKYWFQGDADGGVLWAVRQLRKAKRALIVEGTKPALVAASHAPADTEVYGIAGCWGLSIGNKIPTPDLEVFEGLDVVLCFDADATTNEDVHAAAIWSQKMLKRYGAKSVKFLTDLGDGKDGLDDVLRMVPEQRRGSFLEQAMADAVTKLPAIRRGRGSAGGSGGGSGTGAGGGGGDDSSGGNPSSGPEQYFAQGQGLLVQRLANDIREMYPAALTNEGRVAVYQNGVYDLNGLSLKSACTELLGDRYSTGAESNVESFIIGRLWMERALLPDRLTDPLVNVRNGMLDLATGELHPHSPSFFSAQQLPIVWDEDAKCPQYDEWVEMVGIDGQLADLEEITSTMLDPSMTPQKAIFLFGPSRCGKSTFLRLMQAIAGEENYSAVTLHKLAEDRFAAANVYGKILNVAADLSSKHIQDLSVFKMMTGEDPIQADRKHGKQFPFINRALFAFSANELPTVGESSAAYIERIKPFHFPHTFAGREDGRFEAKMIREELPGILVRWVQAYQNRIERGLWLPTDPTIREKFEAGSDRVRQWVQECCAITTVTPNGRPVTEGSTVPDKLTMTRKEIVEAFNRWAETEHGHSMTGKVVIAKLLSMTGVFNVRRATNKALAINVRLRPESERGTAPVVLSETPLTTGGGDSGDGGGESGAGVAVSETGIATSAPTPGTPSDSPAEGTGGASVAKVAVSNNFSTRENSEEAHAVSSPVGENTPETATSATSALVPHPRPLDGATTGGTTGGGDSESGNRHLAATSATEVSTGATETATTATPVHRVLQAGSTLPEGVVAIDIETADGDRLWDMGPEFVRLVGYQVGDQITVTSDPVELIEVMRTAKLVVGHSIMSFDLVAYARHYGLDLVAMAAEGRVFDTFLTSILIDPPKATGEDEKVAVGKIMKDRKLDKLGAAILGVTKTGDLMGLAKEFKPEGGTVDDGLGCIPVDDERYIEYLRGDVDLTARLAPELRMSKDRRTYVDREHKVAAIAAQIRLNGFRVDVPLLHERYEAGQARKAELIGRLRERYGLPTVKADGKPCDAPQATKEGRAAIVKAFVDLGVELPLTPKGQPSTGKESMEKVAAEHSGNAAVLELVETIQSLNGVRSVYGTVLQHLHGDRVHPDIRIFQASGRWSTVDPGLTVFGKKGGKHVEREIFLPEPGHVIVAADLAQIDARALAALSQDEAYLAMFAPGLDLHSEVAIRAFKLNPPEEIRHDEKALKAWLGDYRDKAKIVGHGWNYGRGPKPLAIDLVKAGMPFDEALETAMEFDRSMTEAFPRLVQWRNEVRNQGGRGELLDNGFGRLMAVHPDRAYTQAPALMGQGCATDHIKQSLLNMAERYPHLLPCIRVSVHDELVFSIPEAEAERYSAEIVDCMTYDWAPSWGERTVFIDAECSKPGINWGAVYAK